MAVVSRERMKDQEILLVETMVVVMAVVMAIVLQFISVQSSVMSNGRSASTWPKFSDQGWNI